MRYFWLALSLLVFGCIGNAQEPQGQAPAEKQSPKAEQSTESSAKPATDGPAVDGANVTGSTFRSEFFKFTYELPKDWQALDDAIRVSENQKLRQEEEDRIAHLPVPKRKPGATPTAAKRAASDHHEDASTERYNLLAASAKPIESLKDFVLPRLNIWAHRRLGMLDNISDHAQYLAATKRATVLEKPKQVTIGGHTFMRVDILASNEEYHSQFVTVMGDYLVGFDFLTLSGKELATLTATMDSIKFD
jgi:hypothetical protein